MFLGNLKSVIETKHAYFVYISISDEQFRDFSETLIEHIAIVVQGQGQNAMLWLQLIIINRLRTSPNVHRVKMTCRG